MVQGIVLILEVGVSRDGGDELRVELVRLLGEEGELRAKGADEGGRWRFWRVESIGGVGVQVERPGEEGDGMVGRLSRSANLIRYAGLR